jgi:hypothetical protein
MATIGRKRAVAQVGARRSLQRSRPPESSTMGMTVAGLVVSLFSQRINRRLGILIRTYLKIADCCRSGINVE